LRVQRMNLSGIRDRGSGNLDVRARTRPGCPSIPDGISARAHPPSKRCNT